MKRRKRKKQIREEEQFLIETLRDCFNSIDIPAGKLSEACGNRLSSNLVYLLMEKLSLESSQWSHRERWLDGIEWHELIVTDGNRIKGKGIMWWGYRNDYSLELPAPFEAEVDLVKGNNRFYLAYKLIFESEGTFYEVND